MPELPEVETIRLQLDRVLKGLRITEVEVLTGKSFIGDVGEVRDVRVVGVKRRGKITIIELEGGMCLAIHLKLTGQLIYRDDRENKGNREDKGKMGKYCEQKNGPYAVCELPNKYTRVIIAFSNGGKLYFNDLRIFGWIRVVRPSFVRQGRTSAGKDIKVLEELGLGKLGPEANDEKSFSLEYFRKLLAVSRKPIKIILMDQEKVAGIGNIYANEALYIAGILPTRKASELTEKDIKMLRDSILEVLRGAIEHKGSSDRDEAYRQITGEKGTHQNYLQVYGRAGEKCPKCGGIIKRIALGGRGTFYCEKCQK